MALDLEALAADNQEAVTYTTVAPDGTSVPHTGIKAIRRAVTQTEAGGAILSANYARWHVFASQLSGIVPKPGDRLTRTTGEVYLVLPDGVGNMAAGTRWQLETRRELGT